MKRIGLLLVAAMLLVSCRAPASDSTLVYGLTLAPSNLDPHVGASAELGIPLTSVYDPLIWMSPDGAFVPGLAERWSISEDGRTYSFDLRSGVTFHDGTAFDAAAVCHNLDRIANPELRSAKARSLLGPYTACTVVDVDTLQVSFATPYAPFLAAASQVYLAMASPTAIEKWGDEYQFHQVGTGPFKFREYIPQDHLLLERNPDYAWAPSFFAHQGPAYLKKVEFRFYVDPTTRAPALESDQVHVMGEIPPIDAANLESNSQFQVLPVAVPGQPLQIYMNTANPPLDNLDVRRALIYATDRDAIVQTVFMGYSPAAYGPLCRSTWGYDPTIEATYRYEPEVARQLLAQAGWKDSDGDGVLEQAGRPLVLEMIVMGWGFMPEVGQMLQAQFEQVGIRLSIQLLAYPAAVQAATEGKHHLIPFTFSSSDPDILRSCYHSLNADGGFNWSKVRNSELDTLLDLGMQQSDSTQRRQTYATIQQRIMDQALIIPIRDYVNLNGVSARVTGLRYDGQGWFPWLYDVRLD